MRSSESALAGRFSGESGRLTGLCKRRKASRTTGAMSKSATRESRSVT